MVFFTCNSCGNAIKKNQVAGHKFKCRNGSVSCMDCGKDFWGNDYEEHIKCITEEEKYSGKNFKPKDNANKGQKRQDEMVDCLNNILKSKVIKKDIRWMITQLTSFSNIPRKKQKFENFIAKCLLIKSPALIAELWSLISEELGNMKKSAAKQVETTGEMLKGDTEKQENHSNLNEGKKERKKKDKQVKEIGNAEVLELRENNLETAALETETNETKSRKKKKFPMNGQENVDAEDSVETPQKKKCKLNQEELTPKEVCDFKWKKTIIAILKERKNHEISFKKLKKKVVAQYNCHCNGQPALSDEYVQEMLQKKIEKCSKTTVEQDRVKLVC